jgi:hypothetical protein
MPVVYDTGVRGLRTGCLSGVNAPLSAQSTAMPVRWGAGAWIRWAN